MSQLSKKKLDKFVEQEMFVEFWNILSTIKNSKEASEFFTDLLTDTEKYMLAKRIMCAVLLVRGHYPSEINKTLHITYSTIGSVASWVKNAKPKTQKVLKEISNQKDLEERLDKIDNFLDNLPPRYGTNWSTAGKEKYQNSRKRSARANLR